MAYRLKNHLDPNQMLGLTHNTWLDIVSLAKEYGWTPYGVIMPGQFQEHESSGTYLGVRLQVLEEEFISDSRLVVLEDALNLADALDRAFQEYEPIRLPADYFYFTRAQLERLLPPSVGAIMSVLELSRLGAFWIEPFRRLS